MPKPEKIWIKTEAERIAALPKIRDPEELRRYAQRSSKAGMLTLAAACEERAKALGTVKSTRGKKAPAMYAALATEPKRTVKVAETALSMLIEDYKTGLKPTTYGALLSRCGFEAGIKSRWFGQVTDLIDAACALADVPSFALVRVLDANGGINPDAWKKYAPQLRDRIIAKAQGASWTDNDFKKMHEALALFLAQGFGNRRAWAYVVEQVNLEKWAGPLV